MDQPILDKQTNVAKGSFNVFFWGATNIGKTSLINHYVRKKFTNARPETPGIGFDLIKFTASDEQLNKVKIWDTSGIRRFYEINLSFLKNAHAVVLVFDLTSRETFQDLGSEI